MKFSELVRILEHNRFELLKEKGSVPESIITFLESTGYETSILSSLLAAVAKPEVGVQTWIP